MTPATITVKAAPGVRVPQEGMPRRYITEAAPVTVPDSAYYRRRIADGDLALAADAAAVSGPAPQKPKEE
ncbi:hypothetical protein DVDV_0644 [Desulfovibrio sp. DV]|uniref:DUF2635 domain-containing protein n=1 Tax=Desulfovibrio sp. DV TaxID=1844708 RepID=UPI000961ECF3|nr:DUF2635 domain-containing protein [Desulfovibrio sp. DV]OLN30444.1 hypothetical protein DVDV_0644 [Desulfovibrio sp. DV]